VTSVHVWVVYESMFGDNQQVASAIAVGLGDEGVTAETHEVGAAATVVAADVDLLVVGCPNHAWSMPRPSTRDDAAKQADGPLVSQGAGVREWLENATLSPGLRTAAYDTRGSHPKAVVRFDHASRSVEKGLARLGGTALVPAQHFLVVDVKGPLEPGELDRAREWGRALARRLGA
jgi:hypothetical protein